MLEYLNLKGMFYYTLKCQIDDNVPHQNFWLRNFVFWFHFPMCCRYIFAIFCIYTNHMDFLDYDIGFKMIIKTIFGNNNVLVCFFLLICFTINLTRMLPKINRSPNGRFIRELVVLNVDDFKFSNPSIRSFQTWPFRFFWQHKSDINKGDIIKLIQLKINFEYFSLMSHQSRIIMLVFVSVCEIFNGISKSFFCKFFIVDFVSNLNSKRSISTNGIFSKLGIL